MSVAHSPSLSAPRRRVDLPRALTAFRRLVADKEDTRQVFEILSALAGRSVEKAYARFLRTAEGRRQARLRAEFADRLEDAAWLDRLPPRSVGASYRDFIRARSFSAHGLANESRRVADADFDAPHDVAWYARRLRDVHDVWHVLTGYGTDALGESCVVAFSAPHARSPGLGLIAVGAALEFHKAGRGHPYVRAIWQAWRNGRKAAWLAAVDYEALFSEPLETARRRLGIGRPTAYESIPLEARNGYRDAAQGLLGPVPSGCGR